MAYKYKYRHLTCNYEKTLDFYISNTLLCWGHLGFQDPKPTFRWEVFVNRYNSLKNKRTGHTLFWYVMKAAGDNQIYIANYIDLPRSQRKTKYGKSLKSFFNSTIKLAYTMFNFDEMILNLNDEMKTEAIDFITSMVN